MLKVTSKDTGIIYQVLYVEIDTLRIWAKSTVHGYDQVFRFDEVNFLAQH